MVRLILYIAGIALLAAGLSWLADRPGSLLITWQGYEIETSVFRAVVMLAVIVATLVLMWSIFRQIWSSPAALSHFLTRRRQKRGLDAISSGMIAIGAGDRAMAVRYAQQARKSLPHEPLTHLLRAQAAQLSGDKATARRIFEAMLASPETEQLGLRGLYLEAQREGEAEVQRQFAERALALNPKLSWPVDGLFDLQVKSGDWAGALATLAAAKKNGLIEKPLADRRRALLLTAQAQVLEDDRPGQALPLAIEAHGLAPQLIPAAAIAGRILAAKGQTGKVTKVIQKTWTRAPHPELATAYAFARIGDSPRDRLVRVKQLAQLAPNSIESWIAVATAAIDAKDYDEARRALDPYTDERLTRRVATLLARIDAEESGDKGRAREWLARAATAPRDAAWTADGVVSDRWAPTSPVTGALDAFDWRVPVDETAGTLGRSDDIADLIAADAGEADIVVERPAAAASDVADTSVAVVEVEREAPVNVDDGEAETAPARSSVAVAQSSAAPEALKSNGEAKAEPITPAFTTSRAPDDPGPDDDDSFSSGSVRKSAAG